MKTNRSTRVLAVVVGQAALTMTAIATDAPLMLSFSLCAVYGWLAARYIDGRP